VWWNSSHCDEYRRAERRNGRLARPIPSAPRGRACRSATSTTCKKLRFALMPCPSTRAIDATPLLNKLSLMASAPPRQILVILASDELLPLVAP
jgi:hypothetical protein